MNENANLLTISLMTFHIIGEKPANNVSSLDRNERNCFKKRLMNSLNLKLSCNLRAIRVLIECTYAFNWSMNIHVSSC